MRRFGPVLWFTAALLATESTTEAAVLITIDKSAQRMTVSVDGTRRWTWPVSTGVRSYDTPNGSYRAFRMEKDHFSKEWDEAPMPHSIFFTRKGHAIHGSYQTRRLGRRASHGCVRLSPANAAKLYTLVEQQGVTSATVVVTDRDSRRR
jgi:lipoprotein-anchoring transpeptidase ErfK/SrfK